MAGELTLASWRSQVNGQGIGSGECVALANDYSLRVVGTQPPGTDGGTHPGYASSMWEAYTGTAYKKVPAYLPMLAGDLPVWRFGSSVAPLSHVAVGLQDLGLAVLVVSQNTNGHRYAETLTLPKAGLLGYLRPVNGAQVTGTTAPTILPAYSAEDLARGLVDGAGKAISAAGAVGGVWGSILAWLTDSENWKRIGIALLGIILIMVALIKIVGTTGAANYASGLIKKA